MTLTNRLMDDAAGRAPGTLDRPPPSKPQLSRAERQGNVGDTERAISVAGGAIVGLLGLARGDLKGLLLAALGGGLVYRGATGQCPAYAAMGVDTRGPRAESALPARARLQKKAVTIEHAFLIARPASQLYAQWRKLEDLPTIMRHLESVTVIDEKRSHWVAKAPGPIGGKVEWDAEITRDDPNERIDWRSLPDSQIWNAGSVRFTPALGDRGTVVSVTLDYSPPGGTPGRLIAKLFGEEPEIQVREDLRNYKRAVELGEVLTKVGQPRGTCSGEGTRESASGLSAR